jgi:ABC-2 type transport system ATP-binding protein
MRTPGRTTLLCTHNLAEAEALCDDVVILRGGRVLVHAPLAQLRQRTQTRLRLRARQGQSVLLQALHAREIPAEADPDSDGVLLALRDPPSDAPPLLRAHRTPRPSTSASRQLGSSRLPDLVRT